MPTETDIATDQNAPGPEKNGELFDAPAAGSTETAAPNSESAIPEPPPGPPPGSINPKQATEPDRIATLEVKRIPLADLKPHPRNPRKHPEPGTPTWETLARSLEHDYFDPIVWNRRNGMLVSGHFRRKVLAHAGYTHADVSVVDYDEQTHLARIIAANKLLGEFDESLPDLARDLEEGGLDAALAGYTEKEFAALLEPPTVDPDDPHAEELMTDAEKLQEKWQVKHGDLFQIGEHRLLCGDCGKIENWHLLTSPDPNEPEAGILLDAIWTDPPYNVDYADLQKHLGEAHARSGHQAKTAQPLMNDKMSHKEYCAVLKIWLETAAAITKEGGAIYLAHAEQYGLETRLAMIEAGWQIKQCLTWVKDHFTIGRQDYQWQHEPILYGWKAGAAHHWQGGFKQSTVIDDALGKTPLNKMDRKELMAFAKALLNERNTTVQREGRHEANTLHPTIKPLPMVARHIWNSTRRSETIGELFGGSGTTLVAAEKTQRRARVTELDPKFCAVILQRATDHRLGTEKLLNHAEA